MKIRLIIRVSLILIMFSLCSCSKLVEVDPPVTATSASVAYSNDATATAVLIGIYTWLSQGSFLAGRNSISLYAALSADELSIVKNVTDNTVTQYYRNAILNTTGMNFWSELYSYIYKCNDMLENLPAAVHVSDPVKHQLMGEAYFIRGLCYFYLVNLYGDVPLAVKTDYIVNSHLDRRPAKEVYALIVGDLQQAQQLLNADYVSGNSIQASTERVRPNRYAALALLARVSLYTRDFPAAEQSATVVIGNTTLYDTVPLNGVFLKNSKEAIWQLQPIATGVNTWDAQFLVLPDEGPNNYFTSFYLSPFQLNAFEPGDRREADWVKSLTTTTGTYYSPYKYKINITGAPITEYQMVLRVGEQYLIRAEAAVQQDKLTEGVADLDVIRARAGLPVYAGAMEKQAILAAILHERQVELFTELGQRWLDLKRTGKVDEVMSTVTPQKGGTWKADWAWYPIDAGEVVKNLNLTQNSGY